MPCIILIKSEATGIVCTFDDSHESPMLHKTNLVKGETVSIFDTVQDARKAIRQYIDWKRSHMSATAFSLSSFEAMAAQYEILPIG